MKAPFYSGDMGPEQIMADFVVNRSPVLVRRQGLELESISTVSRTSFTPMARLAGRNSNYRRAAEDEEGNA